MPDGGIVDDLIVYRLADERFLVVANAGNAGSCRTPWPSASTGFRAVLDDRSLATGLLRGPGPALGRSPRPADRRRPRRAPLLRRGRGDGRRHPGPRGADRLHRRGRLRGLRRHGPDRARSGTRCWPRCATRAGCRSASAPATRSGWRRACRCTATSWTWDRPVPGRPRPGGQARQDRRLRRPGGPREVARDGPSRRLVGLTIEGRGIARHGYPVWSGERRTGVVTSGTQSPTLGVPIAMAYVAPGDAEPGTVLDIEIRDARVPARVVTLPFYRRDG